MLPELLTDSLDDPVEPSLFVYLLNGAMGKEIAPFFPLTPDYSSKQKAFEFYLQWGAYPALTDETLSDEERREILDMYVRTFLERDIRDLSSLRRRPAYQFPRYSGIACIWR